MGFLSFRAGGVGGYAPLGQEGSTFINSSHMHASKEGVVWEGHEGVLVEHFRQHTHIVNMWTLGLA